MITYSGDLSDSYSQVLIKGQQVNEEFDDPGLKAIKFDNGLILLFPEKDEIVKVGTIFVHPGIDFTVSKGFLQKISGEPDVITENSSYQEEVKKKESIP
jgi:hypothetical protein